MIMIMIILIFTKSVGGDRLTKITKGNKRYQRYYVSRSSKLITFF